MYDYDDLSPDYMDNPVSGEEFNELLAELSDAEKTSKSESSRRTLLATLFADAIPPDDPVLEDFAAYVIEPLSLHFAAVTAKGGAFAQEKEAEGADISRYGHDQTMRAHLLNGLLPSLRVMRLLQSWGAERLRYWDEAAERLFIAGYMLHDYNKFPEVKKLLEERGFDDKHQPSVADLALLERITRQWMERLGLDRFLAPVTNDGTVNVDQDVMYVAFNTQKLWQTMKSGLNDRAFVRVLGADNGIHTIAEDASRLSDLITYVARNPRDLVAHAGIKAVMTSFLDGNYQAVGRLVYHHVAENRGLLLNLIHDGALSALTVPDQRVPLLYAPSGVVYLERTGAPSIPDPETLAVKITESIREKARLKLIATAKGAARGGVGLKFDEIYNSFFSLKEMVVTAVSLVEKYIYNAKTAPNKAPARLEPVIAGGWPGAESLPYIPQDKKDSRVDQIAEWAALLETQFTERLPKFDFAAKMAEILGITDLLPTLNALKEHPGAKKGGGIKFHWFVAALHAVDRHKDDETRNPESTLDWLNRLANSLAVMLPYELPPSAQIDTSLWDDLTDYIGRVLTVGGSKAVRERANVELNRYSRNKGKGGKKICAICGSEYQADSVKETVVAFQPTVYTSRLSIGASSAVRTICSMCALEQLLRQLFMDNLDTGATVEGQRVRYLAIYPTYFFTPETLRIVRRVYNRLESLPLASKEWRAMLAAQALKLDGLRDVGFWQGLQELLLRSNDDEPDNRVLRYTSDIDATFFMDGLRSFNDPSDTESWIIPTMTALILSLCLDVKVVVSESGMPIMLEADEMAETIWLDGAHPSVMAILQQSRLTINTVPDALARLAAAYLIHLDTEYEPPKPNWHRFGPIAHSLADSPLYVFHHLKRQERDERKVGAQQIRRYTHFAARRFDKAGGHFLTFEDLKDKKQGDVLMSIARQLVESYRGFYRAETIKNANSVLRPLNVAADALLTAGSELKLFPDAEARIEVVYGEVARFMDRVGKGLANGRFPKGITPQDRDSAMRQFAKLFVENVFHDAFRENVADLRGKKMNLLRTACEYLYKDAQNQEWAERGVQPGEDQDESAEPSSN